MAANKIWPWWLRLSHWLVAAGVIALWVMSYFYHETSQKHRYLAYVLLGIICLRVLAGCVTRTPTAQFYWPSLPQIKLHLKHLQQQNLQQQNLPPQHGHNPLGQLAVYALWACIALLALSGYLSRTDWFWGEDWPVDLHAGLSLLLMLLVAMHLVAVFWLSRLSKQHLVLQMLHGKQHFLKDKSQSKNLDSDKPDDAP